MMFSAGGQMVSPVNSQTPAMVIRTEGMDGVCGCPCCACCISTITFQKQYFVPPECGGRISAEELAKLLAEGDEILKYSHIPVFPIIFMHFCIPFSPVCIIYCYASKRQKNLKAMCERWNNQVFLARGCHVELVWDVSRMGRASTTTISLQLIVHPGPGGVAAPPIQLANTYSVPQNYAQQPQSYAQPPPAFAPQPGYGQQGTGNPYGQPQPSVQMMPVATPVTTSKMDF